MMDELTLNFVVTGEFLTKHARKRVLEGAWDRAVTFLTESLNDLTYGQAIAILSGRTALFGRSDTVEGIWMGVEDDESLDLKSYLARLEWQTAGMCLIRDHWCRPYAVVERLPHEKAVNAGGAPCSFALAAAVLGLARDPARDHAVVPDKGQWAFYKGALFERTSPPPVWMTYKRTLQPDEALDEYIRLRGADDLEILGSRQDDQAIYAARNDPEGASDLREQGNGLLKRIQQQADNHRKLDDPSYVEDLRSRIAAQADAGAGWLELPIPSNGRTVTRVPKAPFLHWALKSRLADVEAPEWTPVCPRDLKMMGDDCFHSDWLIGSGQPLDTWYGPEGSTLREAAYRAAGVIVSSMTGRNAMTLCGRGRATGRVCQLSRADAIQPGSILVIRSADARYLDQVLEACGGGKGAVVVEYGGALAHLVQVARESNVRIVRCDRARDHFPEGALVTVDCDLGQVSIENEAKA